MGTARTSPKVVRTRRAKGIRPNRGNRNDRGQQRDIAEFKAWQDSMLAAVGRLVAIAKPPPGLREEVESEVWEHMLSGESESEVRPLLPAIGGGR